MATQNYFTNYTESFANAVSKHTGVRKHFLQKTVSVLAADDNGSTYLLFKDVPWNARIASLIIENEAITGGTAYDIGLYNSRTGAVVDVDCLAANLDLSAAHKKGFDGTAANLALDGMAALTHEQTLFSLYEIAGGAVDSPDKEGDLPMYDIVLTADTVGTGAGKITARMELIPAG